ncbi:MAG: cyclic pyranopterin monophosphate synthase MoaC [Acidimicrobiia bacterium]|nr:cyclic pyranopterin monophosphate synthase MoaC [Acidimicrobiia bacterium]
MSELSHLDDEGRAAMVDVGGKPETERTAVAEAVVTMAEATRAALFGGDLPKGDAVAVARIAAIMAAKRTADLVPLCHPIELTDVAVDIASDDVGARVTVTCRTRARTGVEMEAMTGASIGAVTIYDMIKGVDRAAEIGPVRLLHKSGGKSGTWSR